MITITYEKVMAVLALFTAACVAAGWLIKIIKALKKPGDDVNAKLKNDQERINRLENELLDISKVQPMILRSLYVILQHMRTSNGSEEIEKQEGEISDYLFNR